LAYLCAKIVESLSNRIKIGTRGSELALWQANFVKKQLEELGQEVEIKIIKTQGDQIQHLSLDKLEGKGFFTSELEDALQKNEVDLAVHSMKDLPTESSEGLVIAGVSDRENPADWLIIHKSKVDASQPLQITAGAVVGTSSNRRKSLLKHIRPDVVTKDIRGNVPGRVKKVFDREVDGVVLAAAGLIRINLDLSEYHVVKLHPREFTPAPAQAVLAYQTNRNNSKLVELIRKHLHNSAVAKRTNVERKLLKLMGGGCHLPLGAYCEEDALGYYHLYSTFAVGPSDPLLRVNLSYSTVDGLAEAVAAKYQTL